MNIAIIGSGLAGLGLAFHLKDLGGRDLKITIFSDSGFEKGASQAATGLIHPYPGKQGRLSKFGREAYQMTKNLVEYVESKTQLQLSDKQPIIKRQHDNDHHLSSYEDIETIGENTYLLKQSMTLYTPEYLKALFSVIEGAEIKEEKITSLEQLKTFDKIAICAGYGSIKFLENSKFKLRATKGQALFVKKNVNNSIISNGYIAKTQYDHIACIGSTYEREYINDEVDISTATQVLSKRLNDLIPEFKDLEIVGCKVGIRVASPNHYLPITAHLFDNVYLFTGLGSRGLLYHSYFGKKLAKAMIFSQNTTL